MREIKFRGKRIDNGKWIYGSLINNFSTYRVSGEPVCYILDISAFPPNADSWEDILDVIEDFEVDGKTVGQFTGLKDKNDKEIWEGDIIPTLNNSGNYPVIFDRGCFMWAGSPLTYDFETEENKVIDANTEIYAGVIGNIHENPELLK